MTKIKLTPAQRRLLLSMYDPKSRRYSSPRDHKTKITVLVGLARHEVDGKRLVESSLSAKTYGSYAFRLTAAGRRVARALLAESEG